MSTSDDSRDDRRDLTCFEVLFDDATVARLMEVADLSHADPRTIIASIVHDVLLDDELAHVDEPPNTLN